MNLGKAFADQLVIVQGLGDGRLEIIPAKAVPAREAWLYENAEALASVSRGLAQAKARRFATPPDLPV